MNEPKDICCDCYVAQGEDVVTLCEDHCDARRREILAENERLRALLERALPHLPCSRNKRGDSEFVSRSILNSDIRSLLARVRAQKG